VSAPVAPFAYGFTVEHERGIRDLVHGDLTWTALDPLEGCAWAPRTAEENEDNRTTVIVGLTLYGPFGADIRFDDRMILPDMPGAAPQPRKQRTYKVIGDPGVWHNPLTGWKPGLEVALERVT
jgi:hypothetical protein